MIWYDMIWYEGRQPGQIQVNKRAPCETLLHTTEITVLRMNLYVPVVLIFVTFL